MLPPPVPPPGYEGPVVVARADEGGGETVLRRRHTEAGPVDELIVNGAFVMDSVETSSERALARLPFAYAGASVLLGGLGLGFTAAELLEVGVARLDVAELSAPLVAWARDGLTPVLGRVAGDARAVLHAADVAALLARTDLGPWDAVLLDVDNGPDFLVHDHNAALYGPAALALVRERLRPGGLAAYWCQGPAPALESALRDAYGEVVVHEHPVRRGSRAWSYVIYAARRSEPG